MEADPVDLRTGALGRDNSRVTMLGRTLSHYEVLDELDRGGMGVVYRARDVRLNREVALKVLSPDLVANEDRRRRFVQEAQAAASLEHPHIAVVYEIDEEEGVSFIAMELIRGEKLSDTLARNRLPMARALQIAIGIAEGLSLAHDKGVVHRDLKPQNVMLTDDGHPKLIDFGLAKLIERELGTDSDAGTALRAETRSGVVMGTVSHMSPEQAQARSVDERTDIFSFGILMYEMLTGGKPFEGPSDAETLYAIIHDPAPPLPAEQSELQAITDRCLAKEPDDRFQKMRDVVDELRELREGLDRGKRKARRGWPRLTWPKVAGLAAIGVVVAAVVSARYERLRWAREEALPEIERLVEEDRYGPAFVLAREARAYLSEDPRLEELWQRTTHTVAITTEPPEAEVHVRPFPEGSGEALYLGSSPVREPVPAGPYWLRIEAPGFRAYDAMMPPADAFPELTIELAPDTAPAGMVAIPPSSLRIRLTGFEMEEQFATPGYWIDEDEVTNREFKEFVDGGGYENPELWKHEIAKDGRVLTFEEFRSEFRDRTGRPAPSTWEGGTYPEGQSEFPVTGVSWYEAAAYAEYAGRSLPTVYHWSGATATFLTSAMLTFSNFGGEGPWPAGSRAPGPFGTHDMAGNVKEWCWNENASGNESERARYILGGGWNDAAHLFFEADLRSPLDRSPMNGFRTALYLEPDDENLEAREALEAMMRPLPLPVRRAGRVEPVSDAIFAAYKTQFDYDPEPLDAVVESVDESSPYWRRERITFDAAYGGERIVAHLFVPRNVEPPYQAVVYFPGSGAVQRTSSDELGQMRFVDFVIKSGRALLFPIYKGTYERRDPRLELTDANPSRTYAEFVIHWVKDVRRSLDYLESRSDIDTERIAYQGFSWGARLGNVVLATEDRFKAAVILAGGFPHVEPRAEVAESNYAPRVQVPVLMINGTYDSVFPLQTNQTPMFESLGSDTKEHVLFDTGHVFVGLQNQMIPKVLDWLDIHLGPV